MTPWQIIIWDSIIFWGGEIQPAELLFKKSTEINPKYSLPYYNLGLVAQQRGDWDKALVLYSSALENQPLYPEAHLNRAIILLHGKKNLDLALTELRQCQAEGGDQMELHYNLGYILLRKGNLIEAEAEFKKAVNLNPSFADSYLGLGEIEFRKADPIQGLAYLNKAVELNPELRPQVQEFLNSQQSK